MDKDYVEMPIQFLPEILERRGRADANSNLETKRQTTNLTAAEAVYNNMKEYSEYTWRSKFPNVIDGLKPVLRRILVSMHNNPGEAKEATVAGRVMAMHPHGDAAISDAIAGLTQPFGNIIPLVYSTGNVGTYVGEKPASSRYLVVEEAEESVDLFFKSTEASCLKMVPCESEKGTEPANFVPVLPTTLLIPVLGIGCAYKTETSAMSVQNVCSLAKEFVRLKYTSLDYKKQLGSLAKYMLPDFPSYCTLRNSKQIVSEYRAGRFDCPFLIDGILDISKDSITIITLPPDRSFGKVTNDVGLKVVRDKTSWLHEHFLDIKDLAGRKSGNDKGKTTCVLRRGENPFEVLSTFKKIVQVSSSWKPTRIYFDDDEGLVEETPISLLDKWADARYKVVLGGLKQKQISLMEQFRKMMALVIIVDHAKEVCDIFRTAKHEDDTVKILVKRFGLTPYQAKYLQTLPLKRLTAKGKSELLAEIERIKEENRYLQSRFTKIPEEIISNIQTFENKYAKKYPPKCVVPKYIGTACYKGTGWIMIETMQEFDQVIQKFGVDDVRFNLFRGDGQICVLGTDDDDYDPKFDVPKYIHASYIDKVGCKPHNCSIMFKDGCAFGPIPSVAGIIDKSPVPVGKQFCTVIVKHEGRKLLALDSKVVRKTVDVISPSVKNVIHVSPIDDDDVIVIHGNTAISGTLVIDRVTGNRKLSTSTVGKTIVVGVYSATSDPILLSVPSELAVRSPVKHLYIKNILDVVKPNSSVKILLTRKKLSTDVPIVQMSSKSAIHKIA